VFIRWKQVGNEKYAYLETRFKNSDGKIRGKSRYLGKNPLSALQKLVNNGEIADEEAKQLLCRGNTGPENEVNIKFSINIVQVLEILASRWMTGRNKELALSARDIVIAAGKMEEYRCQWKIAAQNKGGVYKKWLTRSNALEKKYALGISDDKAMHSLEVMEGIIVLTELTEKYATTH
jgi:Flp pilus assembly CpaF family ATPase